MTKFIFSTAAQYATTGQRCSTLKLQINLFILFTKASSSCNHQGWRMVKSETRRDAEILVRNPSPRLFGKKFRDSKKVKTNHAKTRLRDLPKTLPRFRDPTKMFRDPHFSRYHSPPLSLKRTFYFALKAQIKIQKETAGCRNCHSIIKSIRTCQKEEKL